MSNGRFDYVKYDEKTHTTQLGFKILFDNMSLAIEGLPDGRAKSLALTKLEESYMWVGKALRDLQLQRNKATQLNETRS